MEQNKSDFIRDKEKINKEMKDLIEHLKKVKGLNSDSNMFELGKDANGDVMILRMNIDIYDLPSNWKYGTYLLDSYPKTGFYCMKDGKFMFLPSKNEIDKTKTVEYKTPQQIADAILAENPHIDRTQLSFTHEGIIQITNVIGGINFPTTDLHYNEQTGCIESSIFPDRKFRVELVMAKDVSVNNIGGENTSQNPADVEKTLNQQPVRSGEKKPKERYEGARIEDFGYKLLDFNSMKYAYEHYRLDEHGNVIEKEKHGDVYDVETRRVDSARIEATLELNELWVNAYNQTMKNREGSRENEVDNSRAFAGENTAEIFNSLMAFLYENRGSTMSNLVQSMSSTFGTANQDVLKILLYFVSNNEIAGMFNIELDMSPNVAIDKLYSLNVQHLKKQAQDMLGARDIEEPVMEMKKPGNPF